MHNYEISVAVLTKNANVNYETDVASNIHTPPHTQYPTKTPQNKHTNKTNKQTKQNKTKNKQRTQAKHVSDIVINNFNVILLLGITTCSCFSYKMLINPVCY